MKNVILIGFMGAGKTTVGERYAKKHGLPMVDTDWLIEERAGMRRARTSFVGRRRGFSRRFFPIHRKKSFPSEEGFPFGKRIEGC